MLRVVENTVEQRPETSTKFQAADFGSAGEMIARGAAQLGQGIGDAGEAAANLSQQYNMAAVKQADAEDLTQIAKIRAEALTSQGFDAQDAIGNARQQIEEIRKNRLAGLHNSWQREKYTEIFDQRNAQIEASFTTHSITETRNAERSASLARAESNADFAVDTFGTDAFDKNLATALNEVRNANKGAGDDAILRAQAKVRSQVLSRAIDGLLTNPEHVDAAKLALEQHAADILPDDETALRKKLNPLLEENQQAEDAGWAFTNAPTTGAAASTDPLAPQPDAAPESHTVPHPASPVPVSPADPLRGAGRITNTALQHRMRGSGNALDIAAPQGTPIYPPMSGKVVKSWWDQKGGWSVLIQHPNGYVTGYAHLRSQSPYKEGQEVEANTPIGSVGQTGDATGPHVHYTVRASAGGPKVDPSAALWNKTGTVAPSSVAWKENEPTRFAAEENSLGRALGRLHDRAAAENWSPLRYQRAVEKVRSIAGVQSELYNQQQDQLYEGALESVVKLGTGLTSRSQVPNFGLLKPEHQITIDNIIKGNTDGSNIKANGEHYLTLMAMARSPETRDQFMKYDPLSDTQITPGERAQLFGDQLELRQQPNGKLAADMGKADYFARRYLPPNYDQFKGPAGDLRRHNFANRFMEVTGRQQETLHRPLTDRELDDVARALTVEVVRPGGGGKIDVFELQGKGPGGTVDIPKAFNQIEPGTRQQLVDELARAGRSHSMKDVVEYYLQTRGR